MGGLSGLGRNIGAALSGFNGALDQQQDYRYREQRMGLADADAKWQQQSRQRQQQQWQREDSSNADYEASLQAGRKAMEEDRLRHEQAGAAQQPGVPLSPYQPSPTALLKAAQAQTDELFRRGRMDQGMKAWVQAEGLRGQLRAQAGDKLMRTMASGGDITQPLRDLDDSVDDGLAIESVKQVRGQDGAPVFEIRHRNRLTGAPIEQPNIVSARDMELRITKLLADPKETAKFSFQSYMQHLKSRDDRDNDERTNKLAMDRDAANRSSAEQVARGNNATTIAAAQIRAGAAGRGGAAERTEGARLLREERLAAESEVRGLTDQLMAARRPQERAALQSQLTEARQRVRDIGDKASRMGSGAGAGTPKLMPKRMPTSQSLLVTGELYDTARGPAKWNGSAFELQAP